MFEQSISVADVEDEHVPAQVCDNCGEQYVDDATAKLLLAEAEKASSDGVQVEVQTFAAA